MQSASPSKCRQPFLFGHELLRHNSSEYDTHVDGLFPHSGSGDALFRRDDQLRFVGQIGEKIDQLLDMALEGEGCVDESIIAECFRSAEIAAAYVDVIVLADSASSL